MIDNLNMTIILVLLNLNMMIIMVLLNLNMMIMNGTSEL